MMKTFQTKVHLKKVIPMDEKSEGNGNALWLVLSGCLVEHLKISGSKVVCSRIEFTVTR